jgi:hypothetical protein
MWKFSLIDPATRESNDNELTLSKDLQRWDPLEVDLLLQSRPRLFTNLSVSNSQSFYESFDRLEDFEILPAMTLSYPKSPSSELDTWKFMLSSCSGLVLFTNAAATFCFWI